MLIINADNIKRQEINSDDLKENMKIVFMGTPDFSAVVFEKLNKKYPVCAVVTNPDKPTGRGYKTLPSPLKVKATESAVKVFEFKRVSKEGIKEISELKPDLIVTAAFGQILSDEFLAIPKFGVLNVHASLLPKHRGASPIQQAILDGDEYTGITIMRTVREVDAGDIQLAERVKIGERETAGELFDRLALLGGEAIIKAVELIERGNAEYTPQNHALATYCKMIKKSDGRIDFSMTARELDRFVRGMTPWPSAYTEYVGKLLKIYALSETEIPEKSVFCGSGDKARDDNKSADGEIKESKSSDKFEVNSISAATEIVSETTDDSAQSGENSRYAENYLPGTVLAADLKTGIIVACKGGAVRLEEIQLEGGRRMSGAEFLKGRRIPEGYVFK